ncbi:MAG: hypothetical protein EOM59_12395 [Clostridia bacterium]|nr:hypothetical protein [Clostridia bacterium]
MAKRTRRNLSASFKAKVVVEAIAGEKTLGELAQHYEIQGAEVKALHAKIGRLTGDGKRFFGKCVH